MRTRTTFRGAELLSASALIGLLTVLPCGQPARAQPADTDMPAFKPEELSQMLAPIALYPDSLLSQILMASTYPLEIVQADRWAKAHKDLKGDDAAKALEAEPWDPSVKSLVNFPDVLTMLSDQLEWTQQLGDAFIGQPKEVMDTIQSLRAKAKQAGNLETTKEQIVQVTQEGPSQTIVIEQADPDVIYVPAANPTVAYGSWPYPAYPPYSYYPPGYAWGAAAVSFGVGVACGAAWGYAWGNCNWRGGNIDCDFNRNINRNRNIDRNRYQRDIGGRGGVGGRDGVGGRGSWQHNPSHRKGAPYRNQSAAQKFGGRSAGEAARSREAFRGRADAGRRDLAAGGADQFRTPGGARPSDRSAANRSRGERAGGSGSIGNRSGSSSARGRDGALSGANRGGSAARSSSDRGRSSMGSGGSRGGSVRSSGSRSSGARGGGGRGGGRGGGGRGGGRR